jgi:16S rRNA (cytosine967-C5)-methyltransferase
LHIAQRLAAQALRKVLTGSGLTSALAELRPGHEREHALVQELSYGTLRFLGQVKAVVAQLRDRPIPDAGLEALICVALYQLIHTTAPAATVVDEAVTASLTIQRGAARGLVNAVLRNFLRRRESLLATAAASLEGRFSYPSWWIERIRAQYPAHWQTVLDAGLERPPLTLRVNRRQTTQSAYRTLLSDSGIESVCVGADGVIVAKPRDVRTLPGYAEGLFSVQDHGAQLAAPLLDVRQGARVLDACAAPGGKTTHICEIADAEVLALDSDPARVGRIQDNLKRLQLQATTRVADAADPSTWWDGRPFDRILADVPCTASGIVRRHPDGKWLRRESDIASMTAQQQRLLHGLWPCLAPGGRLLYVTCSLFDEENAAAVSRFVDAHSDAVHSVPSFPAGVQALGGQLLPGSRGAEHNHDGFFYAVLHKSSSTPS